MGFIEYITIAIASIIIIGLSLVIAGIIYYAIYPELNYKKDHTYRVCLRTGVLVLIFICIFFMGLLCENM